MKVWDKAGIELGTPGSAVTHESAVRHVFDCATLSSIWCLFFKRLYIDIPPITTAELKDQVRYWFQWSSFYGLSVSLKKLDT